MVLIKLSTNNKTIILGTHTTISYITLLTALKHNIDNLKKGYSKEEVLDFIKKELEYVGWKTVYDYDKSNESSCKIDAYYRLENYVNKLFFVNVNTGEKMV